MTVLSIGLADLPLVMIVMAGWTPCRSLHPTSERLERTAACCLLGVSSMLLGDAVGGSSPHHLPLAVALALFPSIDRRLRRGAVAVAVAVAVVAARPTRHWAGLWLVVLASGWTLGQYALRA